MSPSQGGAVNTLSSPVSVPATYFGLASQDWPVRGVTSGGNGDHAPTFGFGTMSTYGCNRTHWAFAHPSDGTFDWQYLDALVTGCRAVGCNNGIYVQEGTPAWLAQAGQAATNDPWGIAGGGSMPTDLTKLAAFMTAFANRNKTTWAGFFTVVSILNEPELNAFSGSTVGGWWGTAAQFVDYMKTCRDALKAADPTLIVAGPGTYDITVAGTWLDALGTTTGVYGRQCIDAFCSHPYWATPNPAYSGRGDQLGLKDGGVNRIRQLLAARGLNLPIYCTEYGMDSGGTKASPTATIAAFKALTAAERRTYICRLLLAGARAGLKTLCGWSYGGPELMGDLAGDTTGAAAGFQDAYTLLAGKTLTAAGYYPDGREWGTCSDGTSFIY